MIQKNCMVKTMEAKIEVSEIAPHLRILIVDDHMIMRNMIQKNLRSLNAQSIEMAVNGEEALQKIQSAANESTPYHIIFLDWHMPGVEGIKVLEECQSDDLLKDTAIIMLTAEQEQKSILQALESGAVSYLVKPVSEETFVETFKKVIEWLDKNNPHLISSVSG